MFILRDRVEFALSGMKDRAADTPITIAFPTLSHHSEKEYVSDTRATYQVPKQKLWISRDFDAKGNDVVLAVGFARENAPAAEASGSRCSDYPDG